jgi:acyl-CoA synthetase (AMP-forming)/AMP-acid ligase II
VLAIGEVEEDQEYALLISTCAGTWRYLIGDTIRFTDKERGEILITGRTKHFLSIAGEQLSVENMNDAVKALEKDLGIHIREFTVAALPHGNYFAHQWYIGAENALDAQVIQAHLDQALKGLNKNYRRARERALKEVWIELVNPALFYQWQAQYSRLGDQQKIPRVMAKAQFESWEAFVQAQLAR